MNFNYKNRGFVVLSLSAMLIFVSVVNYKLSKESALSVSEEFKAYEQAQIDKNSSNSDQVVDSIDSTQKEDNNEKETSDVDTLSKETNEKIKETLNSKENMESSTYILDMKMTREKQRNELTEKLNEVINNPSTSDEAKKDASNLKVEMIKTADKELKLENLLSAKGYEDAIVYIDGQNVNVLVNMKEITQNDATKIFDIVSSNTDLSRDNIKLTNNR